MREPIKHETEYQVLKDCVAYQSTFIGPLRRIIEEASIFAESAVRHKCKKDCRSAILLLAQLTLGVEHRLTPLLCLRVMDAADHLRNSGYADGLVFIAKRSEKRRKTYLR